MFECVSSTCLFSESAAVLCFSKHKTSKEKLFSTMLILVFETVTITFTD